MSKHKKIRYIIHYVKPTAQLLFKIRFPKGGPTCRRQVVKVAEDDSAFKLAILKKIIAFERQYMLL